MCLVIQMGHIIIVLFLLQPIEEQWRHFDDWFAEEFVLSSDVMLGENDFASIFSKFERKGKQF